MEETSSNEEAIEVGFRKRQPSYLANFETFTKNCTSSFIRRSSTTRNIEKVAAQNLDILMSTQANMDLNADAKLHRKYKKILTSEFSDLALAIHDRNYDLVEKLIEDGENPLEIISTGVFEGCNMLHIAALHGDVPLLDLLIEQGCKINLLNKCHETPYDLAKDQCHENARVYLKSCGGKPGKMIGQNCCGIL